MTSQSKCRYICKLNDKAAMDDVEYAWTTANLLIALTCLPIAIDDYMCQR